MGGVIAALGNIIAIWLSEGPMDSGFGYFLTAELVITGAMIGYLSLPCSVSGCAVFYCKGDLLTIAEPSAVIVNGLTGGIQPTAFSRVRCVMIRVLFSFSRSLLVIS